MPSCIKFRLSELKKASIRLQNNKFSLKNIRLKAPIPADKEEVSFLYFLMIQFAEFNLLE